MADAEGGTLPEEPAAIPVALAEGAPGSAPTEGAAGEDDAAPPAAQEAAVAEDIGPAAAEAAAAEDEALVEALAEDAALGEGAARAGEARQPVEEVAQGDAPPAEEAVPLADEAAPVEAFVPASETTSAEQAAAGDKEEAPEAEQRAGEQLAGEEPSDPEGSLVEHLPTEHPEGAESPHGEAGARASEDAGGADAPASSKMVEAGAQPELAERVEDTGDSGTQGDLSSDEVVAGAPTLNEEADEVARQECQGALQAALDLDVEPPTVHQIEVPDTGISACASTAQRVQTVIDAALAQIKSELDRVAEGGLSNELIAWAEQLGGHVESLRRIVQSDVTEHTSAALIGGGHEVLDSPQSPSEGRQSSMGYLDLEGVKAVGRELENQRNGHSADEAKAMEEAGVWANEQDAAKELSDLRCMRRQIRYLFGGGMSDKGGDTASDLQDFLKSPGGAEASPLSIPIVYGGAAAPPLEPRPPKVGRTRPPQAAPHPAHPLSSTASSSSDAGFQRSRAEEPEALERGDRKERRHRKHHRQDESVERRAEGHCHERRVRDHPFPRNALPGEGKRDDGAAAPKQWNWAEEMVKASLDPHNQWEFPAGPLVGSSPRRTPPPLGHLASKVGQPQPPWEQPRLRSEHVASKARDRAEEVLRSERSRHVDMGPNRGYPQL